VEGDCVERVAPEFVISDENEKKIKLDSSFDVDDLVLAFPHLEKD
jgi:hypothetical protein